MTVLEKLNSLLEEINIPIETGVFSEKPPDEYIVITPLGENFEIFGDDTPLLESLEFRISLFSKNNYNKRKLEIVRKLMVADFTITERKYVGYDGETQYHNYAIDVIQIEENTNESGD